MKILFVYGSLMKNRSNSKYMKDAQYVGRAVIKDFSIYDLGFFPGIRQEKGKSVLGEVYRVNDEDFKKICELEGEGLLYKLKKTKAFLKNKQVLRVNTFVYNGECERYAQELDGRFLWNETDLTFLQNDI